MQVCGRCCLDVGWRRNPTGPAGSNRPRDPGDGSRSANHADVNRRKIMETPKIVADHRPAVQEIHVLWMTTGLGCDGDSVSTTAATLPSIEDVVLGAIPGL